MGLETGTAMGALSEAMGRGRGGQRREGEERNKGRGREDRRGEGVEHTGY